MEHCESCEYAKAMQKPIGKVQDPPRHENIGDEAHSDLWGPSPVHTPGQKEYFILFTDDHIWFTHLYLLKSKDQTFDTYMKFEAWSNTQLDAKIKHLHSDYEEEYTSDEFTYHLKNSRMEYKLTVHNIQEHNEVAEHLNRTVVKCARALIHASELPKYLWGEAVMHITWLKNHTSTHALENKTPYEMLFKKKSNLSNVPVWGC